MSPKYTALNRYSHWDGSQKVELDADDILRRDVLVLSKDAAAHLEERLK